MPKKSKGTVVAASMSGGAGGSIGVGLSSKAIEQAMSEAALKALADGVTDNDEIKKLKLAAREKVKADYRKAAEEAAKAASRSE